MGVTTKGGANALGSTNDPAWNGSDADATVVALLKAIEAVAGGGSSLTIGGSDTQIQFNDSSALGGDADLTWTKATNILLVGSTATPGIIVGAPASTTTTAGATITLRGGAGGATSGNGGALNLRGGIPVDGDAGSLSLIPGNGVGTNRSGGSITLTGGNGSSTNGNGGVIAIQGGQGGSATDGGVVNITGGAAGTTSGQGAGVTITGGFATAGNPGDVTVQGGTATAGRGGSVALNGRTGAGTAQNGGSISLAPGASSDSGGFYGTILHTKWSSDTGYDYQQPTTGFSQTIADGISIQILDPAGTLATGTVTLPAKPNNGQIVHVLTTATITTLTVSANAGQSIKNAPTTLLAGGSFTYLYRNSGATWFKLQ